MITKLAERSLKTKFGTFQESLYYDGRKESAALVMGEVAGAEGVLCRVHSACLAAHVFNSIECDCREQMEMAQSMIQKEGRGVIIWLDQEGRGHGHMAVMNVARLASEQGIPQSEAYRKLGFGADGRDYMAAAEILADLKVKSIVLITNSPEKVQTLEQAGVKVSGTRGAVIDVQGNETLKAYYADKQAKGHHLKLD
jgi:3,4-dihydroxy 2-butanone 4-phosphate synthase/GTP cyclohydrolase II